MSQSTDKAPLYVWLITLLILFIGFLLLGVGFILIDDFWQYLASAPYAIEHMLV